MTHRLMGLITEEGEQQEEGEMNRLIGDGNFHEQRFYSDFQSP